MSAKRPLGLWMLTALVVGNMIGSGVFLLPAALAAFGSISLWGWAVTGVGALLLALMFARLGAVMPRTGGPYAYCREAFGNFVGFQMAYSYWIAAWVGNAAIALAFTGYLAFFWPELATNAWLAFWVTLGAVWTMTAINVIGVQQAGIAQLVLTIIKLIPLALIAFVGIFYIDTANFSPLNLTGESNFNAIMGAATLTLWAFIGLESATVPADRVHKPHRTIPRATIIGTLIALVVYILGSIAVMGIVPMFSLAETTSPYADAARIVFGPWTAWFIAAGAACSCLGALNGWILLQGQIPLAAAKDGLFPSAFAKTKQNGSPAFGLIFSSVLISILLYMNYQATLVEQFTLVILLATLAALVPYAYTAMAELIIFGKHRERFNGRRLLKASIMSGLAFVYAIWAIIGAGMDIVFYGAVLLFAGTPFYVWMWYKNGKQQQQPAHL